MLISLGEQMVVSVIDNFPLGFLLLLTIKLVALRQVEPEEHSA